MPTSNPPAEPYPNPQPYPSGEQYTLDGHGYHAVVTEVGATLRELSFAGRPLVAGFAAAELRPAHRGAVLAPWPNRIAGGAYAFDGRQLQLALSEPDRHNAIHGLVDWAGFVAVEQEPDRVVLTHRLAASAGYPFTLDLQMTYQLGAAGLWCDLVASNAGTRPAPYGCGSHSYLVAGAGRVDDWTLELPTARYLQVTPDRLLPVATHDVAGTPYDFRAAHAVGALSLDTAFTGLVRGADGAATVRVTAADGHGVAMAFGPELGWVQVYTADLPDPAQRRTGLAVEPMTCPPDAFNSGIDLVTLAPGARHEAAWTIAAC